MASGNGCAECSNCLYWSSNPFVLAEFGAPSCRKLIERVKGPRKYRESVGIITPSDFYCTDYERKERQDHAQPTSDD